MSADKWQNTVCVFMMSGANRVYPVFKTFVIRYREADRVVSSLIALTKAFSSVFGLLTSWEEMVAEFVRSDDITSKVINSNVII